MHYIQKSRNSNFFYHFVMKIVIVHKFQTCSNVNFGIFPKFLKVQELILVEGLGKVIFGVQ